MKRLPVIALVILMGCSGPTPLDRAIWPRHERELARLSEYSTATPREAWYALRAEREMKSVEEVRQADEDQ